MSASIFQQRVRLKYRGAVKAVGDEIPTHFRLILLRVPQGGINSARAGEDWLVILAVTSRQPSRAAGRPGASLQLLAFAYSPRRAGSLTIALPRRRKLRGFRCAPGCMAVGAFLATLRYAPDPSSELASDQGAHKV